MENLPVAPAKSRYLMGPLLGSAFLAVLLYFLSLGPIEKLEDKGIISPNNRFVSRLYAPWSWTYFHTVLHKPLGMYLNLWVPRFYEAIDETPSIP